MTKEEGKGKKRKKGAASEAGNRPSAEEEEEKEENMQTGTANETGKNRRGGRPLKQQSVEERGLKHLEKIIRDKIDRAKKQAFLEMPGIKDMLQLLNEEHKKILADSLKGAAEQGSKLTEYLKQLYERSKREFISQHQKLFQKFFVEGGTIEEFKATWPKVEDEEDRQCKEKMDESREVLELECQVQQAFLKMPGINDMYQPFKEEYMRIHAENLKDAEEREPKLTKSFEFLNELFMGKFISKCRELFQKLFVEGGTIEKFQAMWSKDKEDIDRQCEEKMDKLRQLLEDPEMLEGNSKAAPSNIGSNSEGEWRPSNATLMTGGVTNSINANPEFEERKKEVDGLKKQLEESGKKIQELQEKVSKLQGELAKRDEVYRNLTPLDSRANSVFRLPSLDSMNAGPVFHLPPPLDQSDEFLTLIGQGYTNIDDLFYRSSDPSTVVPDPLVSAEFIPSFNVGD